MRKTIIFCVIFLVACSHVAEDHHYRYIVSSFNKPNDPKEPPPPSMPSYARSNFIIDSEGQVYYYQLQAGKPKYESGINDDLRPPYIDLQPQNIVQIPVANIDEFIKSNILYVYTDNRFISIACAVDTVKAISLKLLIDIFKETSNHVIYSRRKMTQEETIVLLYRKRQLYYDGNSIKWDSTEIRFPHKVTTP